MQADVDNVSDCNDDYVALRARVNSLKLKHLQSVREQSAAREVCSNPCRGLEGAWGSLGTRLQRNYPHLRAGCTDAQPNRLRT